MSWRIIFIATKRLKILVSWKFTDTKWQSPKKINSHQSFHFFFEVVKFRANDYQIFINNYNMIMLMIIIFLRCKLFFHWRYIWAKYFFNHLIRIRWYFKINRKIKNCCQIRVLKNLYKTIPVHLHKDKTIEWIAYSWSL
jgi:hypothetical protein